MVGFFVCSKVGRELTTMLCDQVEGLLLKI